MLSDDTPPPEDLGPPPSAETALAVLPEAARRWFTERVGEPTEAQRLAWPAVAGGRNLLLCAPTGAGKTLAAFLPILGELLCGPLVRGVRCLYLAPLKALANDARRNLRAHLEGMRAYLPEGTGYVRVGLRTGDTSPRVRRRQLEQPPEVLLTTPESLAVMLSQPWSAELFADLRWVVVDEVHALAPGKRGCDVSLSLERLQALAGRGLRRVGLSATCAPPGEAARFLAGDGRPVAVARVGETSALELAVEPLEESAGFVAALVARLGPELTANRSTIVFTNARGLAERLAWQLRRRYPAWEEEIAVHHSALAAARRRLVERALKQGRLRAVVSSTSLELGIDVGSVDGVVLVHPPGDVVRLLQRVGRSGHGPGQPRRGLVLTAGAGELLEAAVTSAAGRSGQLEPLRVPPHPLDVLCQHLAGMAAARPWEPDEAFALARRAYPYRGLSRDDFDACVAYLSGRRTPLSPRGRGAAGEGEEWLPPRLARDGEEFRVADERTARLLRRNLGTIVAEEPRPVRLCEGPAVGEVDEAFAERLQAGDRFLLDGRCLEYRRASGAALLVEEVAGRPAVPRWASDGLPLSADLARRLYLLRVRAAEALRNGPEALGALLRDEYGLGETAAAALVAVFERQECVSEVPDAATCLIEVVPRQGAADCYLHTPLNRAGNDALGRVAVLRLARGGVAAHSLVADLGLLLSLPGEGPAPEAWRRLLPAEGFDADLGEALRESEALRERFRRAAQTGLMLLRNPMGRRQKVGGRTWGGRRLFDQVRAADPGFALLRQAEREAREEVCDAAAARRFLADLPGMALRCRRLAFPSPFVEGWTQVTAGPAPAVETPAEALRRLHQALMGTGDVEGGGTGS
jgi:ATP-dependent Lhr-like helicase